MRKYFRRRFNRNVKGKFIIFKKILKKWKCVKYAYENGCENTFGKDLIVMLKEKL